MDDGKNKDESESDEENSDLKNSEPESDESDSEPSDEEPKEDLFDKYTIDPFLVRREATLLTLVRRAFH
jgi:hypothetical protein